MPEGPEVKIVAEKLDRRLRGSLLIDGPDEVSVAINQRLVEVKSHGKQLLFVFESVTLVSHLRMTGGWFFSPRPHHRYSLFFRSQAGTDDTIHFSDARRFGTIGVLGEDELATKGPDPFQESIEGALTGLRRSRRTISSALLDQKVISGVGNYLKSEILFVAGVSAKTRCCDLSDDDIDRLEDAILSRMNDSYRHGGLSFKDFVHPDGETGNYSPLVYGKCTPIKVHGRVTYCS